ncbi:hypothetical protein L195_g035856, partial [Trifolium pratense]
MGGGSKSRTKKKSKSKKKLTSSERQSIYDQIYAQLDNEDDTASPIQSVHMPTRYGKE